MTRVPDFIREFDGCPAPAARSPRDFMLRGWTHAAASYHDLWGNLTRQSVEPMLDALAVGAGATVLDVACGPGYVAAAAVARGARAVGLDFSHAMARLAARLHPEAEFRCGDAEKLPFCEACFSAVAMNFAVHHFIHPAIALQEARRVLRGGGRVAFSIWANPRSARAAGIVYDAMEAHGTLAVPLPPAPPLWRLDAPDDACRVLLNAGFEDPAAMPVAQMWRPASRDEFWRAFYDGSVRTKALLHAQSAHALAQIRRAVDASVQRFETAGRIEIPMDAWVVSAVARAPGRG